MSQEFDAIYDQGVFRPLQPVDLPDQAKVHLQVEVAGPMVGSDELSQQKIALRELLDWVRGRPIDESVPPVSARNHDQVLYGWQK